MNEFVQLTRRRWLQAAGCGFGSLALRALAADEIGTQRRLGSQQPVADEFFGVR